jgi:predicted nuclease with TOPRIM domain
MKQLKCTGAEPSVKTHPKQPELDFSPNLWDGVKLTKEIKDLKETARSLKYQLTNARRYEPSEAAEIERDLESIEAKLHTAQKELQKLINKYSSIQEEFDEKEAQKDLEKVKARQMFRKEALAKWHPDKFQKDPDYKKFEEFSKTLNVLFDKLEKSYSQKTYHQTADEAFARNWKARQKEKEFEEVLKKRQKAANDPNIPKYINVVKNNSFLNSIFDNLIGIVGIGQERLGIISQAIHKMHLVRAGLSGFTLKPTITTYILPNAKIIKNQLQEISKDLSIPTIQRTKIENFCDAVKNYIEDVENILGHLK